MEPQYLTISLEEALKLKDIGIKTVAKVAVKEGEKKIIGYMVNLSNLLRFLEDRSDILNDLDSKIKKIDELEKRVKEFEEKFEKINK